MRYRNLGLLSCLVWQTTAWKHASESQLQAALDESGYTLVAFILPDQNESKTLEREWTTLQETADDPNILSFDCAAHPAKCSSLEISSFPAIRVYHRDGRINRYRGERKHREIHPFLLRSLRPPILELPFHPSLTKLDDSVIIAQVHPQDWKLYDDLYDLAREYRDRMSFVMSAPEEGATRSVVVCYRNRDGEDGDGEGMDGQGQNGEGEGEEKELEGFVKGCMERRVVELKRGIWEGLREGGRQILHFVATDDDEKERYRKEVRDVVGRYKGQVKFVVTDPTADLGDLPVVSGGEEPRLVLEDTRTGELRRCKESSAKITGETVESFLKEAHPEWTAEGLEKASEGKEKVKTGEKKAEETPRMSHEEL
ncbi:hypothetical protein B0T14DRAFT_492291 [Immersiella caudata]|uniref:Thioredoxin domain-containing protein n=1 Tax=Immersiella caudata TaxID=314043 RepID=A0AA39X219_9PEZI|nr:hypothetical protein B0T14DRAFT_492291 [Immersiella caudata]